MKRVMKKKYLVMIMSCALPTLAGYVPVNFSKSFDRVWQTPYDWSKNHEKNRWKVGVVAEAGTTHSAFDEDAHTQNVLAIYQPTQSALAALLGSVSGSAIDQLLQKIAPATDDGVRGNISLNGTYTECDYAVYARYRFPFESLPGNLDATLYIPFRAMTVSDVLLTDQTRNITNDDINVKNLLTNSIAATALQLGGLDLGSWWAHGLGDFTAIMRWHENFPQVKRSVINVRLTASLGLILPTGRRKDEDKAFSMPLGNDGACGVPLSLGMDLLFKHKIKGGLEVEYIKLFDTTRVRRLKADVNQTDFLLLSKGLARKQYGPHWKFNVYAGSEHFLGGLSVQGMYEYVLHNDDTLFSKSSDFNDGIINTAQSLQEYNLHNLIFSLNYDFFKDSSTSSFKPQAMIFYKHPFGGRRVIASDTVGFELAFSF